MALIDLNLRMDVFRRAGLDLFNHYIEPYAETERDYDVFAVIEGAMFQVMVLDLLNISGKSYGETVAQIVARPVSDGIIGALQDAADTKVSLSADDRICFRRYSEADWYAPRGTLWLLGEISVSADSGLVGQAVMVERADVSFVDIEVR